MKFLLTRLKSLPGGTARPLKDAEYVARPKTLDQVDPATRMLVQRGQARLTAQFRGNPPSFDSEEAQRRYGWTDEERKIVERKLLTSDDYGRGIYLFPGQVLPEEYADIVEAVEAPSAETGQAPAEGKCKMVVTEFPLEVCGDDTLAGSYYCERHFREVTEATAELPDAPQEAAV